MDQPSWSDPRGAARVERRRYRHVVLFEVCSYSWILLVAMWRHFIAANVKNGVWECSCHFCVERL